MGRSTGGGGGGSKRGAGSSLPRSDASRAPKLAGPEEEQGTQEGPTDASDPVSSQHTQDVQATPPALSKLPSAPLLGGRQDDSPGATGWQSAVQNVLMRTAPVALLGSAASTGTTANALAKNRALNSSTDGVREQVQPDSTSRSIEDLLMEQLVAIERALAFNSVIAERLAVERLDVAQPCDSAPVTREPSRLERFTSDVEFNRRNSSPGARRRQSMKRQSIQMDVLRKKMDSSNGDDDLTQPLMPNTGLAVLDSNLDSTCKSEKSTAVMPLFPTLVGVKQLVEDVLSKPSYNVEDHYQEAGFWSWLALHPWFNNATLVVILINTLWIAIDTDLNKADVLTDAEWPFQLMDNLFCAFFALEIVTRFAAFERRCEAFTDGWFVFDGLLVSLMVWETWITPLLVAVVGSAPGGGGGRASSALRVFRVFRLSRVTRTARVLSSVPELMILAKGIFTAMRSVVAILCLLALVIYIFSIVFTQLLSDSDLDKATGNHFQTVPASANFLLLQVLCGFDADFIDVLWQQDVICYLLFLLYMLVGSLTIMNMLIGILCDVVSTVAEEEKDSMFEAEMEWKVQSVAKSLDKNNLGSIAKTDFEDLIDNPDTILDLSDLGVDVPGLMEFAYFVFQHIESLSYANFLHMVTQFRGTKMATVKDIMEMRKQMSEQLSKNLKAYEAEAAAADMLQDRLEKVTTALKA